MILGEKLADTLYPMSKYSIAFLFLKKLSYMRIYPITRLFLKEGRVPHISPIIILQKCPNNDLVSLNKHCEVLVVKRLGLGLGLGMGMGIGMGMTMGNGKWEMGNVTDLRLT